MYTIGTAHEQKGTDSWDIQSQDYSDVHKEPAGIIKKSHHELKNGGKIIKIDKSAHQEKDGFGSSDLRGEFSGAIGPMNVLDMMLMSAQAENHEAAGPEHEPQT